MIRLLFENQVSNCFMTLFSLSCISSIFLSIISILIISKRTTFVSVYLRVSHLYIIKTNETQETPRSDPWGTLVLFPHASPPPPQCDTKHRHWAMPATTNNVQAACGATRSYYQGATELLTWRREYSHRCVFLSRYSCTSEISVEMAALFLTVLQYFLYRWQWLRAEKAVSRQCRRRKVCCVDDVSVIQ